MITLYLGSSVLFGLVKLTAQLVWELCKLAFYISAFIAFVVIAMAIIPLYLIFLVIRESRKVDD